jgi:hypothetical protein
MRWLGRQVCAMPVIAGAEQLPLCVFVPVSICTCVSVSVPVPVLIKKH